MFKITYKLQDPHEENADWETKYKEFTLCDYTKAMN